MIMIFPFSIAAMAITFFKTPKNKQFNYKPVFYDKKKEEREKRMKSAIEDNGGDYQQALRDRIRMRWQRSAGSKDKKTSSQRLIIIILIITVLVYLVFFR
jgi:Flp pilus assembly protein TadB